MSVKILQTVIRKMSPHIKECIVTLDNYESFESYINLMTVERINIPFYFKNINRSINTEKQELLSTIFNIDNNEFYLLFAKVI